MCGIVGVVAGRNIPSILLQGLQRLEYRGYDSSGVAVIDEAGELSVCRRPGKVQNLLQAMEDQPIRGKRVLRILDGQPTALLMKPIPIRTPPANG